MRLKFSLRELETFVAIADYGTFAAAGEAIGLGVSIVPQRGIKQPFPAGVKVVAFGVNSMKRVVGVVERVASTKREIVQVLTAALIAQSVQGK